MRNLNYEEEILRDFIFTKMLQFVFICSIRACVDAIKSLYLTKRLKKSFKSSNVRKMSDVVRYTFMKTVRQKVEYPV